MPCVIVRLFRLLRLLRLTRIMQLFKRWETAIAMPYSNISLTKFTLGVLLTIHWMACIWGLTAELEKLYDPRVYTWFDALVSAKSPPGSSCAFVELDVALVCESDSGYRVASLRRPSAKYVSALYFSVYTLTSIGYGDISAHNPLEY